MNRLAVSSASSPPERPVSLFKYRSWRAQRDNRADGTSEQVNFTQTLLSEARFFCQGPCDFDDLHDSLTGPTSTGSPLDIDRFIFERMAPVIAPMKASGAASLTQLPTLKTAEATRAIAHVIGQNVRREYRILCLSSTGDQELMWAFYADYHRGVCLEFDGQHPFFADARPVTYSEAPPADVDHSDESVRALAFAKSVAWSHQSEWRILTGEKFLPFPREALRRVILGYRFPEHQFNAVINTLLQGGYKVQIDQIQRIPGSYRLGPVKRGVIEASH